MNFLIFRTSYDSFIDQNSLYADLHQYEHNINQEEDPFNCYHPAFFTLQCFINVVVFLHKIVPILSWPILINSCLILLIQQDGSFDNAPCQKACHEILRGICPVTNWTKCVIKDKIHYYQRITGSDPFLDNKLGTIHCIQYILE